MILFELACGAVVVSFLGLRLRGAPDRAQVLRTVLLMAVASFAAEESAIRAYGFYSYAPAWSLFVGHVPLLVVLIWPIVIQSAWDLARQLLGAGRPWVPAVAGAIVLADAALIEPVAVRAGLWAWTEPGLFCVPPIGILGWVFFGVACVALLERARGRWRWQLLVLLVAPAATHVLLLATWWGALRWVNRDLPTAAVVGAAWALSLAATAVTWQQRHRVRLGDMLVRVPPALLFFVLLWQHGRGAPLLWLYALAFVPPYSALTPWTHARG